MRLALALGLVLLALAASAGNASAVGLDACLGRQCLSFQLLPTLLGEFPLAFDTPLGRVSVVPCV